MENIVCVCCYGTSSRHAAPLSFNDTSSGHVYFHPCKAYNSITSSKKHHPFGDDPDKKKPFESRRNWSLNFSIKKI